VKLIRRARVVEPANPAWTTTLAMFYAGAVTDVFFAHQPGDGWTGGTSVVNNNGGLRLPFIAPLPTAEKLMEELETSTDAALIGGTGELLVEEMALLRLHGPSRPEMDSSAVFGKRLLERARDLESGKATK
jgi:hypothetical protein